MDVCPANRDNSGGADDWNGGQWNPAQEVSRTCMMVAIWIPRKNADKMHNNLRYTPSDLEEYAYILQKGIFASYGTRHPSKTTSFPELSLVPLNRPAQCDI